MARERVGGPLNKGTRVPAEAGPEPAEGDVPTYTLRADCKLDLLILVAGSEIIRHLDSSHPRLAEIELRIREFELFQSPRQ